MNKLSITSFTNLGYRLHSRRFSPVEADMTGKTVVVTGSTGGLGLESAHSLWRLGARVVIVGRNEQKLASAAESIQGEVMAQQADLSLQAEVRQLADRLIESNPKIDVLINNVGVLLPERTTTQEGLEMSFATNLAGHFLLTNLLLPRLAESGPARVINVSSGGMYAARIDPDDLQFSRRRYTGKAAYASSKRGQVILTEMWAERFPGREVVFHSMHPGWARTAGVAESLPVFNKVDATAATHAGGGGRHHRLARRGRGARTGVWRVLVRPEGGADSPHRFHPGDSVGAVGALDRVGQS